MPRNYRHIKQYEKEILKLKEEGFTKREIGDKLGFSYEQIHNFISRYNERQRRISAGIAIKRKGRPHKDYVVREEDKVLELRYILNKSITGASPCSVSGTSSASSFFHKTFGSFF